MYNTKLVSSSIFLFNNISFSFSLSFSFSFSFCLFGVFEFEFFFFIKFDSDKIFLIFFEWLIFLFFSSISFSMSNTFEHFLHLTNFF